MAGIRNLSKLMRVPLREAWKHEAGEPRHGLLRLTT